MMSTIKDVAKLSGMSVGSVSRYLNNESLKTANEKKIQDAIQKLNYKTNVMAKGLKENKSMSIGVLINDLSDVFATSVVSALESYIEDYGYSIIVCDYRSDYERMEKKINFLLQRSIDGLVIFHAEKSTDMLHEVSKRGIPIVAIDSPIDGVDTDSVLVDNYQASKEAVQRLIDSGYRNIGLIGGQDSNYIARERQNGYIDALLDADLPIIKDNVWNGNYTIDSGYSGTESILAKGNIDSIFAINYYMGLGSINALKQNDIKIGQNFGFISFDRFIFNEAITPDITSVEQPVENMGKVAGKLLMEKVNEKQNSKLQENQKVICSAKIFVGNSDKKTLATKWCRLYTVTEIWNVSKIGGYTYESVIILCWRNEFIHFGRCN